ncbi:hypothetical protein D3C74_329790 [compost metagenome]
MHTIKYKLDLLVCGIYVNAAIIQRSAYFICTSRRNQYTMIIKGCSFAFNSNAAPQYNFSYWIFCRSFIFVRVAAYYTSS